jgi:hypothetical protein
MIRDRPYRPIGRILFAMAMVVTMATLSGCVIETPGEYRVGWWHHHHDYDR